MIIATRGGKRRVFDDVLWREMPAHKYGWVQSADEPDEVRQLRLRKITADDIKTNPVLNGLEGKVFSENVDPAEKSEIETIREALANPGLHHKTRSSLEKKLKDLEDAGSNE